MIWWLWVLLGIALMAVEAASPGGLFALFFGVSAVAVGVLTALGWSGAPSLQWLLFSALSVIALLVLRGPLKARLNVRGNQRPVDSLQDETAVVVDEIPTGGVGKVELRGSSWTARSAAGVLPKGQRCRVERVDGLTLWVRPE